VSAASHASRLNAGIAASAALAIAGAPWALGQPWMVFLFKPMTTVLIIVLAWPRGRATPLLRGLVLAGLVLSLAGDIALLWPKQGFLPGLIAFLLAHLVYIAAFTRVQRFAAQPLALIVYALLAGLILSQLWTAVPAALHLPVAAYVLALASMAAQAAVVWWSARGTADEPRARTLAIGGALFLCSDALLATNRFALPLPAASLWILATYWAAQWCIAQWLAPTLTPFADPQPGS
jgi:uncharacterized membrane protein YhhN